MGLPWTNNEKPKPQKLAQYSPGGHPPPKATDHGGVDSIKQSPGVHESLRKPPKGS